MRLRSTHSRERLNEELRRRKRVIRIFPTEDSAVRLIGALLSGFHEQGRPEKNYLDLTEDHEWKKQESFNTFPPLAIVE
nr:transposase [Leptospirillum ferriphilum]